MSWDHLDFAPRPPWAGLALLLAGALALAAAAAVWSGVREDVERAGTQAEARARAALPPPAPPARTIPRERAAAVNAAVAELNLPWATLLRTLDRVRPADVALVSLQPGEPSTLVRMTVESASLDSLTRFESALAGQPPIRGVLLRRQERLDPPSEGRFRLTIDLEWQ